jgi:hypothetical protein
MAGSQKQTSEIFIRFSMRPMVNASLPIDCDLCLRQILVGTAYSELRREGGSSIFACSHCMRQVDRETKRGLVPISAGVVGAMHRSMN